MERIIISGDVRLEQVLRLSIITEVNEHGRASLAGILPKDSGMAVLKKKLRTITISYERQEEHQTEETVLFAGRIRTYSVRNEGELYYFEAECVTATAEFDSEKKYRSFQDVKMTYRELVRNVAGDTGTVLITKRGNETLPHALIQYGETDWEFLKRVAGYLEAVLVPDTYHEVPKAAVGLVQGKRYETGIGDIYEIDKQTGRCRGEGDKLFVTVKGTPEMHISDRVSCYGRELIILKKEVRLEKGLLCCTCRLGREEAGRVQPHFNDCLCGLHLSGLVEERIGEKMKIALDIDGEAKQKALCEWPYLPVTGNGMYAMPETGSRVCLYFPDSNEKNAFIAGCLPGEGEEERRPEYRNLETAEENRLELFPGEMRIRRADHSLNLSNRDGVSFTTSRRIRMVAEGNITIQNEGIAKVLAGTSAHMECFKGRENSIHMEGLECTIKTGRFLTSDAGRKAEQVQNQDPKTAWRAAETAKNMALQAMGAIPAPQADGIAGKALGGIPACAGNGMDLDVSGVMGVIFGGDLDE